MVYRPSRYTVIIALAESQVSWRSPVQSGSYLKCGIIRHDGGTAFFFAPVGRGDRLLVLGNHSCLCRYDSKRMPLDPQNLSRVPGRATTCNAFPKKPPLVINNKPKWHVISRTSLAQDPLDVVNKWRWNTNMPNWKKQCVNLYRVMKWSQGSTTEFQRPTSTCKIRCTHLHSRGVDVW